MNEMRASAKNDLSKENNLAVGSALRDVLFSQSAPEDLVARNIQRARDHGIPTYEKLRSICGLSQGSDTSPPSDINQSTWNSLLNTFQFSKNIEAFTGGLAEATPPDGVVGPLFSCIIGMQFKRLKDGDRYFYTHTTGNNARGLPENTKKTVLRRTLGHIICDNTNVDDIQKNVFKTNGPFENCQDIEGLDFTCITNDLKGDAYLKFLMSFECNRIIKNYSP